MGWLAIRENETGAVWEMNQYRTSCRGGVPRGGNREHSFQVGGRFGPVGRAKEVEGHLPLDYSVRLGRGRSVNL